LNKLVLRISILIFISFVSAAFARADIEVYSRSSSEKKESEKVISLENRVEQLIGEGQYQQAMGVYEELFRQKPPKKKKFIYNIKLGDLAELTGDYGLSLDYYKKAESLYKKSLEAKFKIGDILFQSNLYTLSENAFLSALDIDKNSNYAKMRLGDIYFSQSLYQKALEYYLGIDIYYYNAQIVNNIAQCLRNVGKIDEALKITNNFLISNENPQIYFLSAVLYSEKKMYKEAEKQFLNAVRLEADNFTSYVYLAGIYLVSGDLKKAKENLDKAYKLNSSYCATDLLYAQIAYKEGKIYESRRYAHNAYMKAKSDFAKTQSQRMMEFLKSR